VEEPEEVDADTVAGTKPDPAEDLDEEEKVLYEALTDTPVHVDELCAEVDMDPSTALVHLLELEFKGLVRQLAGKQFRRA